MSELFEIIFGAYTQVQLIGYLWFLMIGYTIYGLNETTSRDKLSAKTPNKWNWLFWIKDNWRRYLVTILTTYVMFRFYIKIVGHEFSNYEALMMGMIGMVFLSKVTTELTQYVEGIEEPFKNMVLTYSEPDCLWLDDVIPNTGGLIVRQYLYNAIDLDYTDNIG
jgi:hypothetical protein